MLDIRDRASKGFLSGFWNPYGQGIRLIIYAETEMISRYCTPGDSYYQEPSF